MRPRSSADILASATPAPKKRRRVTKANPFTSDQRFTKFSATATTSTSTPPAPVPNLPTEMGSSSYIPPSTFKFIPASTPETYFKTQRREKDGDIADSGHFDEFDSMSAPSNVRHESYITLKYILSCSSTPLEISESDSSDYGSLNAEPPKTLKSRVQRFEDVLAILREGRLSPFDLILHLLDDANLKYWAYRNELYKEENKKLGEVLELIFSNMLGKEKLKEWILPHALEIVCDKVTDEMDLVQEEERLPGLNAITPEFIKTWRVSGHQEKAPFLFKILLTAAETASAKEKNKKKSPLAVDYSIFLNIHSLIQTYSSLVDLQCNHEAIVLSAFS